MWPGGMREAVKSASPPRWSDGRVEWPSEKALSFFYLCIPPAPRSAHSAGPGGLVPPNDQKPEPFRGQRHPQGLKSRTLCRPHTPGRHQPCENANPLPLKASKSRTLYPPGLENPVRPNLRSLPVAPPAAQVHRKSRPRTSKVSKSLGIVSWMPQDQKKSLKITA